MTESSMSVVVSTNADGRLEIFIVGQNRKLYHRWQEEPNGKWNNTWESLEEDVTIQN